MKFLRAFFLGLVTRHATPALNRECRKAPEATRERRTFLGRVETRALTDAEKSEGFIGVLVGVIPLNTDSVMLRDRGLNGGQPFIERIAPKAFADAEDVIGVIGHTDDPLYAFGRSGDNLTLNETATEIRWEAMLRDTQTSRDLKLLLPKLDDAGKVVRQGIIRGTSFEFDRGATDKWEKRGDGTAVRTVTRGKLSRVNPVLDPAYATSSLSVAERDRAERGAYFGTDVSYDPSATDDTAYAIESLGTELCELTDALEYLRASPSGAHADYAKQQVAECTAAVTGLVAWLAANGAQVDPAFAERAKQKLAEAREATGGKTNLSDPSVALWEKRFGSR